MRLAAAALVLLLLAGNSSANAEPRPRVGVASMAADRTLTVTYDPAPQGFVPPPLVLAPVETNANRQAARESYITMAGGLLPGESKPLYAYDGLVYMADDRSLSVCLGTCMSGPEYAAFRETYRPGQPGYEDWLDAVGGLEPGQYKGWRRPEPAP